MRVGIFYFSRDCGAERWPVLNAQGAVVGFVRVEEVDAPYLSAAFDVATPRQDEALMNTHALDAADWDRE